MRHAGTPVLSGIAEMVDRHGYAPCTAGCKPADLLTNLVFRTRNSYTKRVASSIFSGWHDPFEFFRRATNKNENSEA